MNVVTTGYQGHFRWQNMLDRTLINRHCAHNAVSPTCQQGASSGCVSLLYRDNIQPPCLILAQWWKDKIIGFIKIPGTFGPHTMTGLTIVWPSRKKKTRNVNRYLALALLLIYWAWWVHNYGLYKIYYFFASRASVLLESWPTFGELTHDWFCQSIS